MMSVPNQPKTPHRSVRVPDKVWEKAKRRAASRGETMSEVIRRLLEDYASSKDDG